jgi:hypothetical protein
MNNTPTDSQNQQSLLAALRTGILRAKLDANELTSIGLALKSGMITPEGAVEWLEDTGLITQLATDTDAWTDWPADEVRP